MIRSETACVGAVRLASGLPVLHAASPLCQPPLSRGGLFSAEVPSPPSEVNCVCVSVFLGSVYYMPFTYVSISSPIPCCLDYIDFDYLIAYYVS